jgi:mannosyltransferase OCH1-like enzyme
MSEEHAFFVDCWKKMYADYKHILWNDEMVESEGIIPPEKKEFFTEEYPIALRADILRYELILKNGGIYVDVDTQPLRRMDCILKDIDFFSGIQKDNQVAIGLFGASTGCPLMRNVCKNIVKNIKVVIKDVGMDKLKEYVMRASGPEYFTPMCENYRFRCDYLFLEPKYIYPYSWSEKRPIDCRVEFPEAYSVHHWSKNWT